MRKLLKRTVLKALGGICRDQGGKVIFYHDIFSSRQYTRMATSLDLFKRHVEVARSTGYRFVADVPTQDHQLMVCLDDGFRGVYETKDYFVSNGIVPVISLAVDLVGKEGYLTWAEISELQAAGFIFLSHTWSHRSLTEVPETEWRHELLDSREYLSEKLGRVVTQLCFPRGLYSRRIMEAAAASGYDTLYTSLPGSSRRLLPQGVRSPLCRVVSRNLVQFADVEEFKSVLRGSYIPLRGKYIGKHFKK